MTIPHRTSLTIVLTAATAVAVSAAGGSCSTIAEPSEDAPPVCEFCDVGEQELKCHISIHYQGSHHQHIGDSANVCLDPDATDEEKEEACRDGCEAHLVGYVLEDAYCEFYDTEEPFFWVGCVPPEEPTGGGGGQSHSCPSWYAPSSRVTDYQASVGEATVTIERSFVLDVRSDMFSLYVCDDGRYAESSSGWSFDAVASGELLHELGIRNGDENAVVQGFDPQTMQSTTSPYVLDSVEDMFRAYEALLAVDGVKITVGRSGAPGGVFVIWVTID